MQGVFDAAALIALLALGLTLFLIRAAYGAAKSEGSSVLIRSVEVGVLTLLGGFIARTFIGILLALGHNSSGAVLAISWGFFLWPGAINTMSAITGNGLLIGRDGLLWLALVVGSFVGMMDGLWRIHRWAGLGVLSFVLDVTWGLAANVNASLIHLINFAWGDHAHEPRSGAHRYQSGFRVKSGFAFTQGAVMTNLSEGPGSALFAHERTHVWQNRAFGPLFVLSYLGWMVVMFVPSLIAAGARGLGIGQGSEQWCYWNNPWEAWGYLVGAGPRVGRGVMIWSDGMVLTVAIFYFAGALAIAGLVVARVWL